MTKISLCRVLKLTMVILFPALALLAGMMGRDA